MTRTFLFLFILLSPVRTTYYLFTVVFEWKTMLYIVKGQDNSFPCFCILLIRNVKEELNIPQINRDLNLVSRDTGSSGGERRKGHRWQLVCSVSPTQKPLVSNASESTTQVVLHSNHSPGRGWKRWCMWEALILKKVGGREPVLRTLTSA